MRSSKLPLQEKRRPPELARWHESRGPYRWTSWASLAGRRGPSERYPNSQVGKRLEKLNYGKHDNTPRGRAETHLDQPKLGHLLDSA
ncbi:hypothetical protein BHM03_00055566 [Ensete ventricosum]|nr:hypothetical protein BHM03_00055566 [Ensete ventricosum]